MDKHILKTDPVVFQDVLSGNKTFEIRFNDRAYKVGEIVVLQETQFTGEQMKSGSPLVFTGREIEKRISYILDGYGLHDGWVILGIADIECREMDKPLSEKEQFIRLCCDFYNEHDEADRKWFSRNYDQCDKPYEKHNICMHKWQLPLFALRSQQSKIEQLEREKAKALNLINNWWHPDVNQKLFVEEVGKALRGES